MPNWYVWYFQRERQSVASWMLLTFQCRNVEQLDHLHHRSTLWKKEKNAKQFHLVLPWQSRAGQGCVLNYVAQDWWHFLPDQSLFFTNEKKERYLWHKPHEEQSGSLGFHSFSKMCQWKYFFLKCAVVLFFVDFLKFVSQSIYAILANIMWKDIQFCGSLSSTIHKIQPKE